LIRKEIAKPLTIIRVVLRAKLVLIITATKENAKIVLLTDLKAMEKKESVKVAMLTVIMEITSKEGALTPLETKKAKEKKPINTIQARIQTLIVANMSINTNPQLKVAAEEASHN
jgi:hypothetical protein